VATTAPTVAANGVPGWEGRIRALVEALLEGTPDLVVAPDRHGAWRPLTLAASGSVARIVVSFVGVAADPARRRALLDAVVHHLTPDGRVVVLDHNRPRRRAAALLAVLAAPRVPARTPAARWRRLAYPTAREAQEVGLVVERLRLAAGERVQLVLARPRPPAA
jgi:hypothetical protein